MIKKKTIFKLLLLQVSISISLFNFALNLEFLTGNTLVDILDILTNRFKVRRGIIGFGDKESLVFAVRDGFVEIGHGDKLFEDGTQKGQSRLALLLRGLSLNDSRYDSDIVIFCTYAMGSTYTSNVDIVFTFDWG